jgi:hypothetical protein
LRNEHIDLGPDGVDPILLPREDLRDIGAAVLGDLEPAVGDDPEVVMSGSGLSTFL